MMRICSEKTIAFVLSFILGMSSVVIPIRAEEETKKISATEGFLDVEIEDMPYDKNYFALRENDMFSGGAALRPTSEDKTVPDAKAEPHLDLSFVADKGGTYYIWVRHTGEIVNQRGQSVFVSLGGASYSNFRLTAEPKDPVWVKLGSIYVKEGAVGSVRLRRRQTSDISFDRYIATRDESYVPSDVELGIKQERPEPVTITTREGQATVEAENITIYNNFVKTESFKMSGGCGIKNTTAMSESTLASNVADAAVNIKCDRSGTYYVWAYIRGNASKNTCTVSVNGADYSAISADNNNGQYYWKKILVVPGVSKEDTINIRFRGGRGTTNIDKLCVVNNILKQPYGLVGDLIKKDTSVEPVNGYRVEIERPTVHPRIYFTAEDIPDIIARRDKEQNVLAWAAQEQRLKEALDDSFTGKLSSPASGNSNYSATQAAYMEALAFDYAVFGNVESGKKAVTAMNNYLNTVVFTGAYSDTYVRAAGQLIFFASEVYDWCYSLMDKATREYFIERIIEIAGDGLEAKWPFDGNGISGHLSEAQVQRDLLAFSIAVADERPDIFDRMMSLLYQNYVPARKFVYNAKMPNQGSQYGAYRGQWEMNATFLMDKIGVPDFYGENQRYFPYWFIYARRPDGIVMRDGDARTDSTEVGRYQARTDQARVMLFASSYFKDGYFKEDFNRLFGFGKSFGSGHGDITPVEFICAYDAELEMKSRKDLPLSRYFPSPKGAMFARTGWNDGIESPDVVAYMNLEEYNFSNHDHIDAGHFQIYYKGILANDMGSYITYGSAHDRGYYKRSVAHNTMAVRNSEKPVTFQGYTTYDGGQRSGANGADAGIELLSGDEYKFGEVLGHEIGPDEQSPDYSFLSGNLRKAYYEETVENYERSFMFYNLRDKEHPAALIVFDRVTAQKPAFEKAWLLNGPTKPEIKGNRSTFINNENGYNGKMTVDTLLPTSGNTKIAVIGGEGQDAYSGGVNYSSDTTLNPKLTHEAQGYRIEVSPEKDEAKDIFLNVIQVGDADGEAEAYTPELIQNSDCVGAILANTVTIFKTDYGRSKKSVGFTLKAGEWKIHIADNAAGEWIIYRNGEKVGKAEASTDGGLLSFDGEGGTYTVEYADVSETPDAKIPAGDILDNITVTANPSDIDVKIYNNYLFTPVMGKKYDDKLYVPLRAMAEKLGATVSWENNSAAVEYGKKKFNLYSGLSTVSVNGEDENLPYETIVRDGAMLVPPQFFSLYMYCEWTYDEFMRCIRFRNYQRGTEEDRHGNLHFPNKHSIANELTVYAVLQSGSDGNDMINTLDGNFDTRWSVQGTEKSPCWGIYDVGSIKELDKLYLAYYSGAARKTHFRVEVSEDGETYTSVIADGYTSGETDEFEEYDLGGIRGRYIKIYGLGNDSYASASWNSISEFAVTGR